MKLSLFTPEQTLLKDEKITEVLVPSIKGYLGILPGHAPLVSLLRAGVLKYWTKQSKQAKKLALGWGYLEVHHGDVRILAESAATKESLDRAQIEKDRNKVLEQLVRPDIDPLEKEKLEKEKIRLEGQLEL